MNGSPPAHTAPSVAVVLVNYQAHEKLRRCLASIKQYCQSDLHFIVVENSPESEIHHIAMEHPEITAIEAGANLGFAGGCNLGIAHALGQNRDFILLVNPDTRTEHDFLSPLLAELLNAPRRAMAGPKILRDTQPREVWFGGSRMRWWLGGPCQVLDSRHDDGPPAQTVPTLSGCAMLIRSQAVRKVGMMDSGYFLYFEDSDYCQRLQRAGFDLVYVPRARLLHDVSSTVGFKSWRYVYYFSRNRVWFLRRWATWYQYLGFMFYNTGVKLPGAVLAFGLSLRPDLIGAFFRGYWDGITKKCVE